jgi:endoglucanase
MRSFWLTPRAERRRRARVIAAAVAVAMTVATSVDAMSAELGSWRRGVNMGDYLAYPQGTDWPIFRGPRATTTDAELRRLKAAGFDFIRLAVEPRPFIERTPAEVGDSERRLVAFVRRANGAGLSVMITGWPRHESDWLKPADIIATGADDVYRRYVAFLTRLAELTRAVPPGRVAIELMNEPQAVCRRTDGGPDWAVVQRRMFASLRAARPDLTIVLTTGCWSRLDALSEIAMADYDRNTLVDLHYYEPWTFTHQSATWSNEWIKSLTGLSFPPSTTARQSALDASARLFVRRRPDGTPVEFQETVRQIDRYVADDHGVSRIAADMTRITAWAKAQGVEPARILIGEFGVYRPAAVGGGAADDGSRLRWLSTVRTAIETAGLGWALFAYHAEFGIVTDETAGTLDSETLTALGLTNP